MPAMVSGFSASPGQSPGYPQPPWLLLQPRGPRFRFQEKRGPLVWAWTQKKGGWASRHPGPGMELHEPLALRREALQGRAGGTL